MINKMSTSPFFEQVQAVANFIPGLYQKDWVSDKVYANFQGLHLCCKEGAYSTEKRGGCDFASEYWWKTTTELVRTIHYEKKFQSSTFEELAARCLLVLVYDDLRKIRKHQPLADEFITQNPGPIDLGLSQVLGPLVYG